jgi:N-acetylglucosaminyldiphosphoundecaprenol N-acetyl-beta-D-mannosaminyltransferase
MQLSPDFNRKVYCILGLPFDAVDITGAVERVRVAVKLSRPCFFSTPNLSFAAAVQSDGALRDSVIRSDMSVPDGMPLIWAGRLMGLPMRGRVAGSSMFDRLWKQSVAGSPPIKVFFFGGADGVAARASDAINAKPQGVHCVGFESPGFGSVQAMSGEDRIARINESGAEFIIVSIGVAKGQAWIELNRERLCAPVISYLGAVVNFVAGAVRRAPKWVQHTGLEWLWRIKEEPALWRRYARDGAVYARLLMTRVIPYRWNALIQAPSANDVESAQADFVEGPRGGRLRLTGAWVDGNLDRLRPVLAAAAKHEGRLDIEISGVEYADSAAIALLAMLWAHRQAVRWPCEVSAVQPRFRRMLKYCCADYLLDPAPHAAIRTVVPEK